MRIRQLAALGRRETGLTLVDVDGHCRASPRVMH